MTVWDTIYTVDKDIPLPHFDAASNSVISYSIQNNTPTEASVEARQYVSMPAGMGRLEMKGDVAVAESRSKNSGSRSRRYSAPRILQC